MGDYIVYECGMNDGDVYLIIVVMNVLDFDVLILGNYEFNYGIDFLMKFVVGFKFLILCVNVVIKVGDILLDDEIFVLFYQIIDIEIVDGVGDISSFKIGLIGFVLLQIMMWDCCYFEGKVIV